MVVEEKEFLRIEEMMEANKDRLYEMKMNNGDDAGDKGHFEGSVIAECKFQETTLEEKDILSQIYDIKKEPQ
jgi:hypothetical protein